MFDRMWRPVSESMYVSSAREGSSRVYLCMCVCARPHLVGVRGLVGADGSHGAFARVLGAVVLDERVNRLLQLVLRACLPYVWVKGES